MITTGLYDSVLIAPCLDGANELKIISGFATSAMASCHIADLQNRNQNVKISLLLGMCPSDGISLGNHRGFQSLVSDNQSNFTCSYISQAPPVHGKLYIWYRNNQLYKTFIGSANYTQNAFFEKQREILAEFSDDDLLQYYTDLESESVYCNCDEVEGLIRIRNDKNYYRQHPNEDIVGIEPIFDTKGLESATVSLVDRDGNVPRHSGLNWGHRDTYNRDKNQAYLSLSPEVYRSDFFPPKPQHFTIITDDQKAIICVRAQKSEVGNAIHSRINNQLGEYMRNRLGLASGALVERTHLDKHGRTDVVFYKLDNENYYMDFSNT
ncbi:NgoFVII family restriction endonuclease [Planctomycetales bacterium]|nr:NgoFVII family restriction endonuclease [Planctomycetales bacterium]